ncbi:MAG: response regulator [Acetobacteraceae bacterium]|nr:response regulator [Acetobacteraceae bacterium]
MAARTSVLTKANAQLQADAVEHERVEGVERLSQKTEAVDQLTGGLAHDFNNLLQAFSGSLDLMSARIGEGRIGDLERYITIARTASTRVTSLIHSLLAYSRRQTLDPRATNLNRLVRGMEAAMRSTLGPGIHLKTTLDPGVSSTLCDAQQLGSALLKLVANARDAMPDGGSVVIETANDTLPDRRTPAADVSLRELRPGDYVTLSVTDTGTGMPAGVVCRAFDPFFTTKPMGAGDGLGLSMIYGFIRQSNGHVQIQSQEGVGTCVTIFLPRHAGLEADPEAAVSAAIALPVQQAGRVVLVVEDEPFIRSILVEVLSELGYTVLEAVDGRSGLTILNSAVAVDLLIADVGLPDGMNGRQLADAARERRPELKVLFITGYIASDAVGNGDMAKGMEVMMKPFRLDELTAKVRMMTNPRTGVLSHADRWGKAAPAELC